MKPWPKGVSGNPAGRPKGHDELRALIQQLASEPTGKQKRPMILALLLKMFRSRNPRAWIALLEHGWGKVPQPHELSGPDEGPIVLADIEAVRQRRWEQIAPMLREIQDGSAAEEQSHA